MNIRLIKFDKCPICRSSSIHKDIDGKDFEKTNTGSYGIFHCASCGIEFTNPQPAPEDIGKLYEGRITPDFPSPSKVVTELRAIKVRRDLKEIIKKFNLRNIQVLDYGCGDAFVTYVLSKFDELAKITAVDFHKFPPPLIGLCDKRKIVYMHYDDFRNIQVPQYDLIFCRHVLEHVHNPVAFLAEMKGLLIPGGVLFLELPNYDTIWKRIFGKYYSALYLPRHCYHFTAETLSMVIKQADLEIVTLKKGHLPFLGQSIGYLTGWTISNLGIFGMILFPLQIIIDVIFGKSSTLKAIVRKK